MEDVVSSLQTPTKPNLTQRRQSLPKDLRLLITKQQLFKILAIEPSIPSIRWHCIRTSPIRMRPCGKEWLLNLEEIKQIRKQHSLGRDDHSVKHFLHLLLCHEHHRSEGDKVQQQLELSEDESPSSSIGSKTPAANRDTDDNGSASPCAEKTLRLSKGSKDIDDDIAQLIGSNAMGNPRFSLQTTHSISEPNIATLKTLKEELSASSDSVSQPKSKPRRTPRSALKNKIIEEDTAYSNEQGDVYYRLSQELHKRISISDITSDHVYSKKGSVYVFWTVNPTDASKVLVKVGKTEMAVEERLKQVQKHFRLKNLQWAKDEEFLQPFKFYAKVERLSLIELRDANFRTDKGWKCREGQVGDPGCGTDHKEWFTVDVSEALTVVRRWKRFMQLDPYHPRDGTLNRDFADRLETIYQPVGSLRARNQRLGVLFRPFIDDGCFFCGNIPVRETKDATQTDVVVVDLEEEANEMEEVVEAICKLRM